MIGILSDAHGNIGGFLTALYYLRNNGVKSFYFLGDAVGYIPSLEVVDELISMGAEVKCVLGNHEQMILRGVSRPEREEIYQHQPVLDLISSDQINFLQTWPSHRREIICGSKVLFVHGSPRDYTNEYVYPDTDLACFNPDAAFVFMGHSHYPFIRSEGGTTFVNVGSCGLPRDDGRFGSFAIFNPATKSVSIYRYSIEKVVAELHASTLERIHPAVLQVFQRRSDIVSDNISN